MGSPYWPTPSATCPWAALSVIPSSSGAAEYDRAQAEAQEQSLDFLDVLQPDLTIISSAHWPARFGYRNDWSIAPEDWHAKKSFLARIPLPEGNTVALVSVRSSPEGKALVAGGRRLNAELLKSLGIAPGMRALLWRAPDDLIDAQGAVQHAEKLEPLPRTRPVSAAELDKTELLEK